MLTIEQTIEFLEREKIKILSKDSVGSLTQYNFITHLLTSIKHGHICEKHKAELENEN